MLTKAHTSLAVAILFSLTACGGGGDSSDTSAETPDNPTGTSSQSDIIKNANNYNAIELENAATQLVDARYTGSKSLTTLTLENTQHVFKKVVVGEGVLLPNLHLEELDYNINDSGKVDFTAQCSTSGSIKFKGQLSSQFTGNLAVTYNNCSDSYSKNVTGNMAFSIKTATDSQYNFSFNFDNLSWKEGSISTSLTGTYGINSQETPNTDQYSNSIKTNLLYTYSDQTQALFKVTETQSYQNNQFNWVISGAYFHSALGQFNISTNALGGNLEQGKIIFKGTNSSTLEFWNGPVKYTQDTDNNGIDDVGTYFSSINDLINSNLSNKQLVDVTKMSLPPEVYAPSGNNYQLYTSTPLTVSPGHYYDPDNSNDQLTVSYRWYINGQLVSGQTSYVLPAHIAVYGDEVKVAMVVFDGINTVESDYFFFTINDSPAQFNAVNLPSHIQSGQTVQFSALLTDPDNIDPSKIGSLISGPSGATIDSQGLVTWQVGNDYMFPLQSVDFVFALTDSNGNILESASVSLDVNADQPLPLTRSGIEVPRNEKSMWMGDFDGDGNNELVSTDNNNRLFMLTEQNGSYIQTWFYPFKLATKGRIQQVLVFDTDKDNRDDIVVITTHGISVINDLNALSYELFSTDDTIFSAAIDDIDNDGIPEIAYLHTRELSGYDAESLLSVISMSAPSEALFSVNIDAQQVIFANVDLQAGLELITNSGLVYDTQTWQNKWANSMPFGDRVLTIGDYNGDGVNEIAGGNYWSTVSIYSAVNKSQLATVEVFNTCSINTMNLDDDAADELVVGECQSGEVHAYNLNNNELSEIWSLYTPHSGVSSLTVGDSDNDGEDELQWGLGTMDTGEDRFIVADIGINTIDIKQTLPTIQLDSFSSAGWSTITDNDEKAVFFVPQTGSGYDGSRVLSMATDGSYQLSEQISSNWDKSFHTVTTDYNHDGFGDLLLPTTDYYDGRMGVMQLFDYSFHWQSTTSSQSDIGVIKAFDINQDGFEDAIYADGKTLKIVNIEDQSLIAQYSFESNITDFVINEKTVIVARDNIVSLLTLNTSSLSEQSFINQNCQYLTLINKDSDAQQELMCINTDHYENNSDIYTYEIANLTLVEKDTKTIKRSIYGIAIDETTSSNQGYFVAVQVGQAYYSEEDTDYHIEKHDVNSNVIWRSPSLIGQPSEQGLKARYSSNKGVELMLSTNKAMYLIN
ncbi:FG-GAP repeat domain-containing protein [Shewanella saliphila]|uniref:FG-GAP repeat protein n=1 Tax=Shewanella saliphila TaxID=2282698 RepID=A0ABQ2Q9J1_9GAMM|nr:VCBS repeat-containing protein [Shewanella saliphila]MCL1102873.1 VCBS repeat-containing protein [Shewanella saliphila]GGP63159.1 hypothetical protein GCM10009409_31090 [Shewanella saliphila]